MKPLALIAALVGGVLLGLSSRGEGKTQTVRLVDVVVLGPFLVFAAVVPKLPPVGRFALALAGAATVVFNGLNLAGKADGKR